MNKNSSEPPFLHFSPQTYVFYCPFLPPISVAAMSTSPHEFNLCPMLPHHFLLRAKSLPGPTLRAPPKPEAGFRPLPSQVYIYIYKYVYILQAILCGDLWNFAERPARPFSRCDEAWFADTQLREGLRAAVREALQGPEKSLNCDLSRLKKHGEMSCCRSKWCWQQMVQGIFFLLRLLHIAAS